MATIRAEYPPYSVAELEQILRDPIRFAQPFSEFVRDVGKIDGNLEGSQEQIDQNTSNIAVNTSNIAINTSNITANSAGVTSLNSQLTAHVNDASAHGANGDIVGTLDFCTSVTGGVVLLAALVADAVASTVDVTSPDAAAAPVAYDQTQIQGIVDLVNELKSDVNQLVSDVNDALGQFNTLLAEMKTAKQMST